MRNGTNWGLVRFGMKQRPHGNLISHRGNIVSVWAFVSAASLVIYVFLSFHTIDINADTNVDEIVLEFDAGTELLSDNNLPLDEPLNTYDEYIEDMSSHQTLSYPREFDLPEAFQVCVVAPNPRHSSMFRHNLIHKYGSGRYNFTVTKLKDCPKTSYRVLMVHFVKCCVTKNEARQQVMKGINFYDVTIVTGDEYCLFQAKLPHYRQYFTTETGYFERRTSHGSSYPKFMPLGPRTEFSLVDNSEVKLLSDRRYTFNFIGSLSSASRKRLNVTFMENGYYANHSVFIHTTERWQRELTKENGYISPSDYRKVLLDSIFTLCPYGHNPEAYRIYEACEAGSIPILIKDDTDYDNHRCKKAYQPLLNSEAPFVWLNSWDDLGNFLDVAFQDQDALAIQQKSVISWYHSVLQEFSLDFERTLEWRHQKRSKGIN